MARALLLDDDKTRQSALKAALEEAGHEVQLARNGRNAVELAVRWRPDILLTEWLLEDRPNGIEVVRCLRSIRPELHAILVTRFPSEDVRQLAIDSAMLGYFTHPVQTERLADAIAKALEIPPRPVTDAVAFLEHDESGRVVSASPVARELLGLAEELGEETRLSRLFDRQSLAALEGKLFQWTAVKTFGADAKALEVFPMDSGAGNRCLLLVPAGDEEQKKSPVVRLLVDSVRLSLRSRAFRKPKRRALVIDSDRLQRRLTAQQLETLGVQFHAAESLERGASLLEADERVGVVIVDYGTDGEGVPQIVQEIHDKRPDVRVVGTSLAFRKREFADLGADGFLPKPVTQSALRQVVDA